MTLVERLRKEAHDLDAAYRVPADGPSPTSALLLEAADALATAPPEREAVRVLEERSRQVHRLERERTATLAGAHGTWMGKVYEWEECPSAPCCNDRQLLVALRAEGEGKDQGYE